MDLGEAMARLLAGDDSESTVIEAAARADPSALRPFHDRLIDAEAWVWPWRPLWVAATEETAARLVAEVDAGAGMSERWLMALGLSRTRTAAAALSRWTKEPPPVAASLYVPIAQYAHEGGWELGTEGIRPLSSLPSYALTPTEADRPLAGCLPLDERCPWCGLALLRLLDVDLDDPGVAALGLAGHGRVVATTCLDCGSYTDVLGEYRPDGTATWSDANTRPGYLPPAGEWDLDLPTERLGLGPLRCTPVEGIAWNAGGSTLGGLPDWIQDADYPSCPRCRTTLYFLAQLTGDDLWGESAEGCHYVFFCADDCRTTAVVYQQS
ncbi:hypothetical protein ABH931_000730 [Streptacidiphilus sp. MAP12-33]|uniref:hypothetical protein n=1 Tax=Streptacidiphilus sp. MAP12-33 TaxID=3156266 RepID=UPI0035150CD6